MPSASPIFAEASSTPSVILAPVARRTVGDDVLETLRKAVISGAYAPGDHLAEGVLAQQLGVSRAPVREAMMQLEREGLLVFDRRGAARVKIFTDADFEELFSLRLALETMAARLAARRSTETDFAGLADNIARTRTAAHRLELTLLDIEFHDRMVAAARHSRLQACWAGVRHQLEYWLARLQSRVEGPVAKTRDATVRHHLRLVAALKSGSESRAARAVTEHIEGWRRQLPRAAVTEET